MEIGISSEQLVEIGLNMIGFLASGLLVIVLHSVFRKKDRARGMTAREEAVPNLDAKKQFNAVPASISEPEVEFINLKGAAWKPKKNDRRVPANHKDRSLEKQEVIRMANRLLSSNGRIGEGGRDTAEQTEELPVTGGNIELQSAGRIK